jgi:transitional endoplasmic reticulum ATPase
MVQQRCALAKGSVLDGKYSVLFFIKKGHHAETYRVRGRDGKVYFLKLFNAAQAHRTDFDADGNLLEIEFLKKARHPSIVAYRDSGEVAVGGGKFFYLALDFIAGETLAERIVREPVATAYDIRRIMKGVLDGLAYLHSLPEPVIHNEITPANIMLDLAGEGATAPVAKIIDFGGARSFLQPSKAYNKEGLSLCYTASECITAGAFSPQSDLFSAGAVLYQLLFGMPPWSGIAPDAAAGGGAEAEEALLEARERPLLFPDIAGRVVDFDDSLLDVLAKALDSDTERRFQSAGEFLRALDGEGAFGKARDARAAKGAKGAATRAGRQMGRNPGMPPVGVEDGPTGGTPGRGAILRKPKGNGFADIAGMDDLKRQLEADVIDAIRNPEEYRRHHLGLPNGMLLYGPSRCGKTFFAEKFAEEAGYAFRKVVASDIASIYVHGTQEKVGRLFDEARASAPAILYFDELDAMTPARDAVQPHYGAEVNEFLSQLDNIGDSGVFVIGSTNKPQLIDKAVLNAGRLEKLVYVPPPDFAARQAMFRLYLEGRPLDFGIDYGRLAALTENFRSGTVKLVVDEASRQTIREKAGRITMAALEAAAARQKPIPPEELQSYEKLRVDIEGRAGHPAGRRIGF